MNWTASPFSRGALAAALALIPAASFMTGCLEEMNLTGSNGGTGGDGAGGMAGTGATGATGGSSSMGGSGMGGSGGGGVVLGPWSKSFGNEYLDGAGDTAVDSAGNVVVTGNFGGTADFGGGPLNTANGSYDTFVAKLDSSGNHVWSKRFGDKNPQYPVAVAIDGAGNVVVTGPFQGTVDFGGGPLTSAHSNDIFVAKLDSSGDHLWSKRFGGAGYQQGCAVAIDSAGNVVVAGEFESTVDFGGGPLTSAGSYDIYVAKLDANGDHVWSKRFGDAEGQNAISMAIDSAGNVAITGQMNGTVDFGDGPLAGAGGTSIYVAKLDPNGDHVWSKRFENANGQSALATAVDSAGNVAITGYMNGTVDFGGGPLTGAGGTDIFVAKLDPNGNHVWSKRFGDANDQEALSIAIDTAGNVVITGKFFSVVDFGGGPLTSAGDSDIFVAKLDPNGDHLWSTRFGDWKFQAAYSTAIDSAGNVVITGNFEGTVDFGNGPHVSAGELYDVFLAKLMP
jgi:hypothetical protein